MWTTDFFGEEFYYIFYVFFLYSFLGWIYESCYVSIQKKTLVNRGFLNGPVIPIYGCGALLVYLILWDYRDNILLSFMAGLLLTTLLEYFTSLIMELAFRTRWWDYSNYRFNLQGRICLGVSILWGILVILMQHVFQPGINYLISLIPRKAGEIAGYIIILLFIADLVVTVIYTIRFKQLLEKFQKLRQDIMEYIASIKIYETGEELKARLFNLKISGIFSEVRSAIEQRLNKASKHGGRIELRRLKPDMDRRMSEFVRRYQSLRMGKIHARILKAFPTMKVRHRDLALKDVRERSSEKEVYAEDEQSKEQQMPSFGGLQAAAIETDPMPHKECDDENGKEASDVFDAPGIAGEAMAMGNSDSTKEP